MGAGASIHPTDQTLRFYGLGKLDDTSAELVGKHLESCPGCQSRVAQVSSDSFLGRLRGAGLQSGPAASPPVVSSLAGLSLLETGAGAGSPPPNDSLPPGLADHPDYEVVRELGQGGMGTVYLARNRLMGRYEVLKVVSSHMINRRGVLDRFLIEIRNAARLHHTNVVTAYAASRLGESIVFAMEYVEGLDLAKLVKTKGALPVANACNDVHQAALGLQHAADHGMVHRDIKPSNLMLARQGQRAVVKVLDFGLAKIQSERAVDGDLTHEGQMLGTPDFIAPEQIRDARGSDIRADIYSLGCTLYYLLTGGPPFHATCLYDLLQAHHSMYATPLNLVRPDVPIELAALVAKMMAKEPERRFQLPVDLAHALTPFFKKGRMASAVSTADVSIAGQPDTKRAVVPVERPAETARAESPWESLLDLEESEPSLAPTPPRSVGSRAMAAAEPTRRPPWAVPSLAAGTLILGIVAAWGAGAFHEKTRLEPREAARSSQENADDGPTRSSQKNLSETSSVPSGEIERKNRPEPELERDPMIMRGDKAASARPRTLTPVNNDDGFRTLFDYGNLAGWSGLDGIWSVKDGTLTGNSFPGGLLFNTCLCSDQEYADFELSFQARTTDWLADSGVQIRSRLLDPKKFAVAGPQCDMGAQSNMTYWGNLWGEQFGGDTRPLFRAGNGLLLQASRDLQSRIVKRDDYNDVVVRCVGKHVTIKVNGETAVDGEVHDLPPKGIIGWQLHYGKPMEVKFRHVKIRTL